MSRSYAPLLTSLVMLSVPATAFADCPSTMTLQNRINCLNTALNAAATSITALETANDELEASNAELVARVDAVEDDVANISADYLVSGDLDDYTTFDYVDSLVAGFTDGIPNLSDYLLVDTATDSIVFTGANVYVQNGTGATEGTLNGLGNLIVGYNEDGFEGVVSDRTGSHNLVVGTSNSYSSFGSFVAGQRNAVTAPYTSVSGGAANVASARYSAVSGGSANEASGDGSSVTAGFGNLASGDHSSVTGGTFNWASTFDASVSGGTQNLASESNSSVCGGADNVASGIWSAVSGGLSNVASGSASSVSGGQSNTASGTHSSVLGGKAVTISATDSHSP